MRFIQHLEIDDVEIDFELDTSPPEGDEAAQAKLRHYADVIVRALEADTGQSFKWAGGVRVPDVPEYVFIWN